MSPRNGEQLLERVWHLFFCGLCNKKLYWSGNIAGESDALSGQFGQIHTAENRFAIVLSKKKNTPYTAHLKRYTSNRDYSTLNFRKAEKYFTYISLLAFNIRAVQLIISIASRY